MEEILRLVTVAEFNEFKARVMNRLGWSRTQFNDRKLGRIKVHSLELKKMHIILQRMREEQEKQQYEQQNRVFCNSDCLLYANSRCPFDSIKECPMYQPITNK